MVTMFPYLGGFDRSGRKWWPGPFLMLMAALIVLAASSPAVAKTRRETLKWDPGIEEIAHRVERLRGLHFERPVRVEFVGQHPSSSALTGTTSGSGDGALRREARHLVALGLLGADVDLSARFSRIEREGVLGYYDPDQKQVVVSRDGLDPFTRVVVAHELTHALDDQHYNFTRAGHGIRDSIGARAYQAVVEGDARRIQDAYRGTLPKAEQREVERAFTQARQRAAGALPNQVDLEWFAVQQDVPYTLGKELTKAVVADGGNRALARLITQAPLNDVSLLDPVISPLSATTWIEAPSQPSLGEAQDGRSDHPTAVDVYLTLASRIPAAVAFDAASHANGATLAYYRRGTTECARLALVPQPGSEPVVRAATDAWIATVGPTLAVADEQAGIITLTTCSGSAPLPKDAIAIPELLLAARGRAITVAKQEGLSPIEQRCLGDAVLRDDSYRDQLHTGASSFGIDRGAGAFRALTNRARLACAT
jgi:hypothetical protein